MRTRLYPFPAGYAMSALRGLSSMTAPPVLTAVQAVKYSLITAALAITVACGGSSPTMPSALGALHPLPAPVPTFSGPDTDMAHVQGGPPRVRKANNGTLTTTSTGMGGSITLSGPRFEVTGSWSDGGSTGCQPCQSGRETIWTSASFTGSPASATVDGVRYEHIYLSGGIRLSGSVDVPSTDSPTFTVQFPATVDGSSVLVAYASNPWVGPAQELFRFEVRRNGTGSVELNTVTLLDATRLYTARTLRYAF